MVTKTKTYDKYLVCFKKFIKPNAIKIHILAKIMLFIMENGNMHLNMLMMIIL